MHTLARSSSCSLRGINAVAASLSLCVLLMGGGCTGESSSLNRGTQQRQLLIGLVPAESLFRQLDRYEPLARYLSARTGYGIRLIVLPGYENIVNRFTAEKMDAAFFGSFTYIQAHEKLGVEALARPEKRDGTSTYHGLIFVRKDSGIRSVRDMQGKRLVFVDRGTTAGWLLPLAYFKQAGVNYRTYLRESYFAGTHEDAIADVLDGAADIGAAKNTEFERAAAADPRIGSDLLILARSPDVPENSLAVRQDLDPVVKEKLKAALLAMGDDREGARILKDFGAQRFIETTDSDFRSVYAYARSLGKGRSTRGGAVLP